MIRVGVRSLLSMGASFSLFCCATAALGGEWPHYGGGQDALRFSPAAAITTDNVRNLTVAWRYSTGDLETKAEAIGRSSFQATPILAAGALVFCTPFNEVIALDPATGEERWRFDPEIDLDQRPANQFVCRGVEQWTDDRAPAGAPCATRIFTGTNDARLIALDAESGLPCREFGDGGEVRIDPGMPLVWPGEFQITSPPLVLNGVAVVGSAISDGVRVEAPLGTVRAFDARTGAPLWRFHPVPEQPDGLPRPGHANVWAPMSADRDRGLVYLPTSSAAPDFFGGMRPDNPYSNSVVALDVATGAVVWSFQTLRHDVWDYDLPAQPTLFDWPVEGGGTRPALVQPTKQSLLFILDRETGGPLLPVEDRPVPSGGVAGETLSPVQPFPVRPPPLVPTRLDADEAWGLTFWDRGACRRRIDAARSEGLYTPPALGGGTVLMPSNGGGLNWGGVAVHPDRRVLVVNANVMAHHVTLFPSADYETTREVMHDSEVAPQTGAPFGMVREMLLSPLGLPCNPPPWGKLVAVDLVEGKVLWDRVLGDTRKLAPLGLAFEWGTPSVGGPLITGGGLVFVAATMDDRIRAFDLETGALLWDHALPAGGQATPMTYQAGGRQFVVVAAGGHARMATTLGDEIVAFALPPGR